MVHSPFAQKFSRINRLWQDFEQLPCLGRMKNYFNLIVKAAVRWTSVTGPGRDAY
jgi:hypothetical protein